jgi:poly-gamma-glutamate synthesis protein (capsule biosynthesis protein)
MSELPAYPNRKRARLITISLLLGIILAVILGLSPAILSPDTNPQKLFQPVTLTKLLQATPTPIPTVPPAPRLTLDQIFTWTADEDGTFAAIYPQDKVRQVLIGGDVMLGRSVGFNMTRKRDFGYPFTKIGSRLQQADVTIFNLENPIVSGCPLTNEGMRFCSSVGTVETLQAAGVDVVQIANNHAFDYGQSGLAETVKALSDNGIKYAGLNEPAIVEVRGVRFGILGYAQLGSTGGVISRATAEKLQADIADLKRSTDIILVGFHWGQEYVSFPNNQQISLARAAIDNGADAVFGHHSHWIQGIEVYKSKPIFYSLGNLVFDQMQSRETREGLVVELTYYQQELIGIRLMPIFMEDYAQPDWQPIGYGSPQLSKVKTLSEQMAKN